MIRYMFILGCSRSKTERHESNRGAAHSQRELRWYVLLNAMKKCDIRQGVRLRTYATQLVNSE